jgi:hypothetical protein
VVTVTVPKSELPHVKTDYGILGRNKPEFALRFKACPRSHNPRTGFPGHSRGRPPLFELEQAAGAAPPLVEVVLGAPLAA